MKRTAPLAGWGAGVSAGVTGPAHAEDKENDAYTHAGIQERTHKRPVMMGSFGMPLRSPIKLKLDERDPAASEGSFKPSAARELLPPPGRSATPAGPAGELAKPATVAKAGPAVALAAGSGIEPTADHTATTPCSEAALAEEEARPTLPSPGQLLAAFLSRRLASPRSPEATSLRLRPSLQAVAERVAAHIEAVLASSSGCSVLVRGPPGSGKTLAVERAIHIAQRTPLAEGDEEEADERGGGGGAEASGRGDGGAAEAGGRGGGSGKSGGRAPASPASARRFGVVRLRGSAHGDERAALRACGAQLVRAFADDGGQRGDGGGPGPGNSGGPGVLARLADDAVFLREALGALARGNRAVVFVLEGLEGFALRSRQGLLYALLDAIVTSGARAAVLATTARVDCVELLEKRVRSRFGHRVLDITPPVSTRPAGPRTAGGVGMGTVPPPTTDCALDLLRACLELPAGLATPCGAAAAAAWGRAAAAATAPPVVRAAARALAERGGGPRALAGAAGSVLARTARLGETALNARALLEALRARSGEGCGGAGEGGGGRVGAVPGAGAIALLPLPGHAPRARPPATLAHAVSRLPVLEAIVLVAASKSARHAGDEAPISFELLFREFCRYTRREEHVDMYTRTAARRAFDSLRASGLLTSGASGRGEGGVPDPSPHAPIFPAASDEELLEGLKASPTCPALLREWAASDVQALNTSALVR